MRFHSISSKMKSKASSKGKDIVLQFSAKYEAHQYAFCGGGYIKLLPDGLNQKTFGGNDEYSIMFGPDLCGYDVSHIHLIFNHKGNNLLKTEKVRHPRHQPPLACAGRLPAAARLSARLPSGRSRSSTRTRTSSRTCTPRTSSPTARTRSCPHAAQPSPYDLTPPHPPYRSSSTRSRRPRARSSRSGTSPRRRSTTRPIRSRRTGLTRRRSTTPRTRSPTATTTSRRRCPTPTPPSPRTGTTRQ